MCCNIYSPILWQIGWPHSDSQQWLLVYLYIFFTLLPQNVLILDNNVCDYTHYTQHYHWWKHTVWCATQTEKIKNVDRQCLNSFSIIVTINLIARSTSFSPHFVLALCQQWRKDWAHFYFEGQQKRKKTHNLNLFKIITVDLGPECCVSILAKLSAERLTASSYQKNVKKPVIFLCVVGCLWTVSVQRCESEENCNWSIWSVAVLYPLFTLIYNVTS